MTHTDILIRAWRRIPNELQVTLVDNGLSPHPGDLAILRFPASIALFAHWCTKCSEKLPQDLRRSEQVYRQALVDLRETVLTTPDLSHWSPLELKIAEFLRDEVSQTTFFHKKEDARLRHLGAPRRG